MFNIIKKYKNSAFYKAYLERKVFYTWWNSQPNQIKLVEKYFKYRTDVNDYAISLNDGKHIHRMEMLHTKFVKNITTTTEAKLD